MSLTNKETFGGNEKIAEAELGHVYAKTMEERDDLADKIRKEREEIAKRTRLDLAQMKKDIEKKSRKEKLDAADSVIELTQEHSPSQIDSDHYQALSQTEKEEREKQIKNLGEETLASFDPAELTLSREEELPA